MSNYYRPGFGPHQPHRSGRAWQTRHSQSDGGLVDGFGYGRPQANDWEAEEAGTIVRFRRRPAQIPPTPAPPSERGCSSEDDDSNDKSEDNPSHADAEQPPYPHHIDQTRDHIPPRRPYNLETPPDFDEIVARLRELGTDWDPRTYTEYLQTSELGRALSQAQRRSLLEEFTRRYNNLVMAEQTQITEAQEATASVGEAPVEIAGAVEETAGREAEAAEVTEVGTPEETNTIAATAAEETPAEEGPAMEAPANEISTEETPAEENPAEEVAAEAQPGEASPAEEDPSAEAPANEISTEETPAEENPAEEVAAEAQPGEASPAEEAQVETVPIEAVQPEGVSLGAAPDATSRRGGRWCEAEWARRLEESRNAQGAWLLRLLGYSPETVHAQNGDTRIVRRRGNLFFIRKLFKKK